MATIAPAWLDHHAASAIRLGSPRLNNKVMAARHARVAPGGRIVIPAEFRQALGLKEGDPVVPELAEGELRVRSLKANLRQVQDLMRRYVPVDRSLADELVTEPRAEAARRLGE